MTRTSAVKYYIHGVNIYIYTRKYQIACNVHVTRDSAVSSSPGPWVKCQMSSANGLGGRRSRPRRTLSRLRAAQVGLHCELHAEFAGAVLGPPVCGTACFRMQVFRGSAGGVILYESFCADDTPSGAISNSIIPCALQAVLLSCAQKRVVL